MKENIMAENNLPIFDFNVLLNAIWWSQKINKNIDPDR